MSSMASRCPNRLNHIPLMPCNLKECDWWLTDPDYNCCFWVLSNAMDTLKGNEFSVEEIAKLEGVTPEEVEYIIESSLTKIRLEQRPMIRKLVED